MHEIVFVGGPRDGDKEFGQWVEGGRILTLVAGDLPSDSSSHEVVELAWHVYFAAVDEQGAWHAEYRGRFGPRELPSS